MELPESAMDVSKFQNVFEVNNQKNIKSIDIQRTIFFQFYLLSYILFVDIESRLVKVWQRNICR